MAETVDLDGTESIDEMEQQLEELRVRRHDLDAENRENLRDLEDAVRYGVEGLQGEHYLDPVHMMEMTALAALPDDMVPEDRFEWEDEGETEIQTEVEQPLRTLDPESLTPGEQPVDREPGRPVDEIIEDVPQTLEDADEYFSQPPQKDELDSFYDAAKELLNQADWEKYDTIINEAIREGDIGSREIDDLKTWDRELRQVVFGIQELNSDMIEYKQGTDDKPTPQEYSSRFDIPDAPAEFNRHMTAGLIEGYADAVELFEEAEAREKSSSSSQNGQPQREPLKEYQQQIKVDQSALPDNASTYEQQLFDAGARYNHESDDSEVDVDMMREIIRDVRGFDVPEEMTPSYEDKQAEAYGDLKGAVEAIVEDSDMEIGSGAGNRQALNQLVAGIQYTESNGGVYEEEHVVER